MGRTAVIGDVHGDYERMLEILEPLRPDDRLIMTGDYFDRGPAGRDVVEFAMSRPFTDCLFGNHEGLILLALDERRGELPPGFRTEELWRYNGGQTEDLEWLAGNPAAEAWLRSLPVMLGLEDGTLIQHCDAKSYLGYGRDLEGINAAFLKFAAMKGRKFHSAVESLFERRAFTARPELEKYLRVFGAKRLVHGHTPHEGSCAAESFDGMIVNVDGALSRGWGPGRRGFLFWP